DRHQARVARKQVPQARQRDIGVDLGEEPQAVAAAPQRRRREQHERDGKQRHADMARAGRVLYAIRGTHPCTFGKSPSGRIARMSRKAKWPAGTCQPGSARAPMGRETPRMMPPEGVPHMLPSPPMITASKPKIRRAGPIAGSKLVRTARNTPATAMMASDSAMASANTWRLSSPISCATLWSSEVARKARPTAVR